VDVVGRTGGEAVVKEMRDMAPTLISEADFHFFSADLSSTSACNEFISELAKASHMYAGLIMTLGVWPDFKNPATPEGFDRVVFIDIIARFSILQGMIRIGVLEEGAVVMNVLASGMANSNSAANVALIKGAFGRDKDRRVQMDYMKGVVAPVGDIMLAQAAIVYPDLRLIGTNPGIVPTSLIESTIGETGSAILWSIANYLKVTMSEEQCGKNHLNILYHTQVNGIKVSFQSYSFVIASKNILLPRFNFWLSLNLFFGT
jgi:hypothetical protein